MYFSMNHCQIQYCGSWRMCVQCQKGISPHLYFTAINQRLSNSKNIYFCFSFEASFNFTGYHLIFLRIHSKLLKMKPSNNWNVALMLAKFYRPLLKFRVILIWFSILTDIVFNFLPQMFPFSSIEDMYSPILQFS